MKTHRGLLAITIFLGLTSIAFLGGSIWGYMNANVSLLVQSVIITMIAYPLFLLAGVATLFQRVMNDFNPGQLLASDPEKGNQQMSVDPMEMMEELIDEEKKQLDKMSDKEKEGGSEKE